MTPRGFGQKEEFYWRGGMAITFCIMTITSYRDVEAAGVRNMGTIWRWAEVAEDGWCGFREVFNLHSRSDAPLNSSVYLQGSVCLGVEIWRCYPLLSAVSLLSTLGWVGCKLWGLKTPCNLWEHKIIEIYWKFARQSGVPISDCKSHTTAPLICTNV